jgi:hypothetical protein
MNRKYSRFLPLALVLGLAACDEGTTGPGNDGPSRLTVQLTDAPGDFHAAVVTISEINLLGGDEPISLLEEPFTGDLLELRNDVATLVQGFELPVGTYSELRLVIDGGYIEVETASGTQICASSPDYEGLPAGADVDCTLHMPSMGQSGLKVKLPGDMLTIGEGETVVLIDFDVAESFGHQAGNSGRWIMHPVIFATDVTFGGNVLAELALGDGVVLPEVGGNAVALEDFSVELVPAGGGAARTGVLVDADVDGDVEYLFKGLMPGDYTLEFIGPDGLLVTYSESQPVAVSVFEKQTTGVSVTIDDAEAAGTIVATLALNAGVTLPDVGGNPVTLGAFRAELTPDGGSAIDVLFTDADEDGEFEAVFDDLPAGDYSLTVLAATGISATYDVSLPIAITLAEGATEVRPIVVTAASLVP